MAVNLDADLYLLLGAMIASDTITFEQGKQWVDFRAEAKVQHPVPMSLEAGVDMALSYFRADPDVEAEREAAKIRALHEPDTCPDCGGPMEEDGPDDHDFAQAMMLWEAVRGIADKYAFDRCDFTDHERDIEEC